MVWIYFGFAVLLSSCGLRCVDCTPSFTREPNNPEYVDNGASSLNLHWDYNADEQPVSEVDLLYVNQAGNDVVVARKTLSGGQFQINSISGYSGRVSFSGSATFTITNIVQSDSRRFKCRVTFTTFNPPEITSNTVVVVVVKPTITLKTSSPVVLDEGQMRILRCTATGNPTPSYTWTKGITVLQQGSNSNYTITSAKREDIGRYTCTAEVVAPGYRYSATYYVDVNVRYAPQVTSLVPNQTLNDKGDAEFFCTAVAYPLPITYNWFKNVTLISSGGDFVITDLDSRSKLTVKQITKTSADRYSCSGRNSVGTGELQSVFLKVNYAPQTVTVTINPTQVREGQGATLECHTDGYPAPSFSWKFNGIVLNGALNKEYLLANAEVRDSGNYTCIATNFRGNKQFTRVLNVRYKPTVTTFTTGTGGNTAVLGRSVTITCSADGYPAPTYTIKRNNTDLTQSGGPGKVVINNVQLNAEYNTYSCVPTNDEGSGPTASFSIVVQVPPRFPAISLNPETKVENQTHTYSCTAEAKPAAEIRWVLNGENLTHTPPYNISTSFSTIPGSKLSKTLGYLTITKLTWRQNGSYSCIAYNDAGDETQSTVLEVRFRPVAQYPNDQPKNLTLAEGARATFNCKTTGNPPTISFRWQFNGVDIPGESCHSGCSSKEFTIAAVRQEDAGLYSCIGTNNLGDGPPASAELFVKHPPKIKDLAQTSYTVNETNSVTMVCRTEGVPKPTVTWRKTSNGKDVGEGEVFTIANTSGSDDGKYTCIAVNELGLDSKEVILNVQTRPVITTSTPMATNIPGAVGERVELTCLASAKPPAQMSWKRNLNGNELTVRNDDNVESISTTSEQIKMTVNTSRLNEKFYCVAVNLLGRDYQAFTIRERGAPDPPQDVNLVPFQVPNAKTVSVNVSWTPGYNGGFQQQFSIHYRTKESAGDFTEESIGNPPNHMHTVQQLRPETEYEFKVGAANERGRSETSEVTQVMTVVSARPPDRGTVKATRSSDDPAVIIVTWTVTDETVTTLKIELTEGSFRPRRDVTGWLPVPGSSEVTISDSEFMVENLEADKAYTFRVGMARSGEDLSSCPACYVYSDPVSAAPKVDVSEDDKILQDWMIAVIAGVAGFLLLCIVVLCLCCFIRRKKAHGADRVNMSQTSSYVVGGPEVNRSLDPRPRSFGMESVEDDPFIEAHFASMQSMTTADGKKKKPDNSVNYGYLSQDSVQNQPEMLLNPGSRLARNRPVAQSTGNLETNSAYPARGPQRDFNTLPPYYEPPSFEEAMRQSGRKQKTRKSTGDLVGPGQGRYQGRIPKQSAADEPTDSSDGETRFTPQRAAPPPPRVRHVESSRGEPGYTALERGRGLGSSQVIPHGPTTTSGPRDNGPLDPLAPYAVPHKKRSKKSRGELSEPAIGPPPQYTPEERPSEDPMQHSDLDLDDPSNLPISERPPDLPPPMAMLPSNRPRPSFHDDTDGLPEPPAFLRDVVYPPDGREPRYESDDAVPYQPRAPPPAWQRQPYMNINGQLVKAPSREYSDYRRAGPLRSSRDRLTPEPEMPPRQWESQRPEPDERAVPEMNYVSYLV